MAAMMTGVVRSRAPGVAKTQSVSTETTAIRTRMPVKGSRNAAAARRGSDGRSAWPRRFSPQKARMVSTSSGERPPSRVPSSSSRRAGDASATWRSQSDPAVFGVGLLTVRVRARARERRVASSMAPPHNPGIREGPLSRPVGVLLERALRAAAQAVPTGRCLSHGPWCIVSATVTIAHGKTTSPGSGRAPVSPSSGQYARFLRPPQGGVARQGRAWGRRATGVCHWRQVYLARLLRRAK